MRFKKFAWRFFADLPTTRLAALPFWAAVLVLAIVVTLTVEGALPSSEPVGGRPTTSAGTQVGRGADLALYLAIQNRIAAGQDYYSAAISEQRARRFPLRPFVTVRLPTVATINGKLGTSIAAALLASLTLAAAIILMARLYTELGRGRTLLFAVMMTAIAIIPLCLAGTSFHEPWAAVLIVLSLALRTRRHWMPSVAFGLAAAATRELAMPYLFVMAAAAVLEGARREAAGWLGASVVAVILIGLHAHQVASLVWPTDLASPGWNAFGGWPFVLQIAHDFTSFSIVPTPLSNLFVPLSLLGWAGLRGSLGLRAALLLGGYACLFMLFGRPDNGYWGVMMAPLLPIGLVFAPAALLDLATTIHHGVQERRAAYRAALADRRPAL